MFDLTGSYTTVWDFLRGLERDRTAALCAPIDERDVTALRPTEANA